MSLIDEFAIKIPIGEPSEIPLRSSQGLYLYQSAVLSAAPIEFPELAGGRSIRYVTPGGTEQYVRMSCLMGTPWALRKASDAAVAKLIEEMVRPEPQAGNVINLGW